MERSEMCQRVKHELVRRIRAAGFTVGTPEAPDDLGIIDGIPSDFHMDAIERWGKPGVSVWFGMWSFPTHGEVKSDRRGGLDWNQVVDNLRTYLDEKKRRLKEQQRVESLRQQAAQVIEACGVQMHLPRHCEVGRASLKIEERDVFMSVRVPIRHSHKLQSLIEFLRSY